MPMSLPLHARQMDLLTFGDHLYTRYYHFVPSPDGLIAACMDPDCFPAVVRWRIEQAVHTFVLPQTRSTRALLQAELDSLTRLHDLIQERRGRVQLQQQEEQEEQEEKEEQEKQEEQVQEIAPVPFTGMPHRALMVRVGPDQWRAAM
jgi:hypothetical protein